MDLKAIADGIATTIGTVTANGETATATARLPNQVSTLALLVYPPIGDLEIGIAKMRNDHYVFPVKLLRDPTDVPGRSDALYAWATALRDLVETNLDLGLTYVARASVVALRMEIDGEKYSSVTGDYAPFDVVELRVNVLVREVVTTVSV